MVSVYPQFLFVRAGDGRIIEANEAAEKTYGYTRGEILELSIRDLRMPKTLSDILPQMRKAHSA